MSSNVGLTTPRGSGTSGYVQRNAALLKPRDTGVGAPYNLNDRDRDRGPKQRKPDQQILLHDRMREIEIRVLEFREGLEEATEAGDDDDGGAKNGKVGEVLSEEEIEERCEALRRQLSDQLEREMQRDKKTHKNGGGDTGRAGKGLKSYQVHELAEAKERESERLRRALGLRGDEVGDDSGEHPMARQDKRRREKEGGFTGRDEKKREEQRTSREQR